MKESKQSSKHLLPFNYLTAQPTDEVIQLMFSGYLLQEIRYGLEKFKDNWISPYGMTIGYNNNVQFIYDMQRLWYPEVFQEMIWGSVTITQFLEEVVANLKSQHSRLLRKRLHSKLFLLFNEHYLKNCELKQITVSDTEFKVSSLHFNTIAPYIVMWTIVDYITNPEFYWYRRYDELEEIEELQIPVTINPVSVKPKKVKPILTQLQKQQAMLQRKLKQLIRQGEDIILDE